MGSDSLQWKHLQQAYLIKDIKIEFWKDESQEEAICTYQFKGWISNFSMEGGGGSFLE
jgi:hypothetical protein